MQAIDNKDALNYCKGGDNTLAAAVTFTRDTEAKTFTVTDGTTYAAGDSRKVLQITIFDKVGGKVESSLGVPGSPAVNAKVVNIETLNPAQGLSSIVTVVSDKGKIKDGSIVDSFADAGAYTMEK